MASTLYKNIYLTISFLFLISIFCGTLLFYFMPSMDKGSIFFIDALFLATSALSVTGIATFKISLLSVVGKSILVFLIIVGGLGLSTLIILISFYFYKEKIKFIAVATRILDIVNYNDLKGIIRIIFYVSVFVLLIGTIFFYYTGFIYNIYISLYDSFFMCANTFCNAGFQDYNNITNLIYQTPLGMIASTGIILVGSIGFLALYELVEYIKHKNNREPYFFSLTLQIGFKIYIYTLLFAIIFLFFLLQEYNLIGFIKSIFYGVSLRSCGLYFDHEQLFRPLFIFFMILYSFLGTLPLSTGSGLKTSIIGIIWKTYKAFLNQDNEIIISNRVIPFSLVIKAIIYCLYVFFSIILLSMISLLGPHEPYMLSDLLINIIGAFMNSGIHIGSLDIINTYIKIILIISMILGRLGIIFLLIWQKPIKKKLIKYPEEEIVLL